MKFVVIGASAAGISTVKKLRELNPKDEIVLISKDETIYSRCILFRYLEGTRTLEELNFGGLDFEHGMQIRWVKGIGVSGIDISRNVILLENDEEISYDKLCIASGARTNYPPIPGLREAKNVVGFRNLMDVEEIQKQLGNVHNIFVMGAGLVGIDVIEGLLPYHKNITLADMGPYMLPIQLDEYSAKVYQDLFTGKGVKQYYETGAKEFALDEAGKCYRVVLENGVIIPVDLVINCAGVRSNVEFLKNSGIECDRLGLVIDEYGTTNVKNVYGAGDVTGRTPIWPVAVREGIVAAYNMSGIKKTMEEYLVHKSSMNFQDLPTVSIGNVNQYAETYTENIHKDKEGNYCKIISKNDVIVGALLQGNLANSGILSEGVRLKKNINNCKIAL